MRRWLPPLALVVVAAGVVSVTVRTRMGDGPTSFGSEDLLAVLAIAVPSLLIPVTRTWPVGPLIALAGAIPWLPLVIAGDLSCVDCGFALLLPLGGAAAQLFLFVAALVFPGLRHGTNEDSA